VLPAIFLLLVATSALLQFRLFLQNYQAAERLEKACLQTVALPKKDVHWVTKGKELRIGQRFFDVKTYKERGNELIVTGVFDDDETAIEKKIDDVWQKEAPQQMDSLAKYFGFLNSICFAQTLWHLHLPLVVQKRYYDNSVVYLKPVFLSVSSPPPQENNPIFLT
jgi:hypothetical protein